MSSKLLTLIFVSLASLAAHALERPPQFVMLAFDNCQENQTWSQVSRFLEEMNAGQPDRLRFTFFLSAAGLLTDQKKAAYLDPAGRAGKANIDFGGSDLSVLERVAWINKLHAQGNEIASHTVGHFSGKSWTVQQWRHEFDQYARIVDNLVQLNGWTGTNAQKGRLDFRAADLQGFRAPYLEGGARVNQVLVEKGFRYDTSDTDQGFEPGNWPRKFKNTNLWNFGLSFVTLPLTHPAGAMRIKSSVKVPAMDYNFCFRQTGGCPDRDPFAGEADKDAAEMLQGYLNYFLNSYNGNRAPMNIGHHFQPYRGGSYNRALMKFARLVCGLPEVKCATYRELADFMDAVGSDRDQFQAGKFPKAPALDLSSILNL